MSQSVGCLRSPAKRSPEPSRGASGTSPAKSRSWAGSARRVGEVHRLVVELDLSGVLDRLADQRDADGRRRLRYLVTDSGSAKIQGTILESRQQTTYDAGVTASC